MTDKTPTDLIATLRERYTAEPVPPCRVCGAELSIGQIGGGMPTRYGCATPEGVAFKDWHYGDSSWTQYRGGDSDVLALIEYVERLPATPPDTHAAVRALLAEWELDQGDLGNDTITIRSAAAMLRAALAAASPVAADTETDFPYVKGYAHGWDDGYAARPPAVSADTEDPA